LVLIRELSEVVELGFFLGLDSNDTLKEIFMGYSYYINSNSITDEGSVSLQGTHTSLNTDSLYFLNRETFSYTLS
jgi:hypothetical protein